MGWVLLEVLIRWYYLSGAKGFGVSSERSFVRRYGRPHFLSEDAGIVLSRHLSSTSCMLRRLLHQ